MKALCPQVALLPFLLGSSGDGKRFPPITRASIFKAPATFPGPADAYRSGPLSSFVVSSLSAKGASGPRKGQKST